MSYRDRQNSAYRCKARRMIHPRQNRGCFFIWGKGEPPAGHAVYSLVHMTNGKSLAVVLVGLIGFLSAAFLLPFSETSLPFTKELAVLVLVVFLFALFAVQTLRSKAVAIPRSLLITSLALLPLAYLVSALFSSYPPLSLWGYQLSFDTFGFILLGAATAIAMALFPMNIRQIFSVVLWFFAGGCLVLLFQVVQFLFGGPLPGVVFSSPLINLVGSWNGFGIFVGLLSALSLVALESIPLKTAHQWLLKGILVLSLVFLIMVHFVPVWWVLAIISFAIVVASALRSFKGGEVKGHGVTAGVILVIALFFALAGNGVAAQFQNVFGIQTLDVRPSVESTLAIAGSVYSKNSVFGTGPNTFPHEWFLSRPAEIIGTPFWGVAFNAGFASIPSSAAVGGIVVALAWLLVLIALGLSLLKALLSPLKESHSYFTLLVSAVGSLYLAVFHLIYVPDIALSLLMFFFFGLLLLSMREAGSLKVASISFSENPRAGFVSIFAVLVIALGGVLSLYGGATLYASSVYQQIAIERSSVGDFDGARNALITAVGLSEQDRHYQTFSAVELARLNVALNNPDISDTERQAQFRDILSSAINAAVRATDINPGNYYNWISRASVYASVVPLNIEGALENSLQTLEEARKRNPLSPEVDFRIAQIQAIAGNADEARNAAMASLQKKPDYTQAILLLADLALAEGNLSEAIDSVAAAVFFEPQNSLLLYQLGLLNLQAERYEDARDAFRRALEINPQYANAAFFLGRALYFLGDFEGALESFRSIRATNPDNQVLESVIATLERGDNPFSEGTEIETPTE